MLKTLSVYDELAVFGAMNHDVFLVLPCLSEMLVIFGDQRYNCVLVVIYLQLLKLHRSNVIFYGNLYRERRKY